MMATQKDLAAIDRLIKPPEPPERIYGWMESQLSVARHYGGCRVHGAKYVIAPQEDGQPLVRWDVLKREAKAKKDADKAERVAQKSAAKQAQGGLLCLR